MIKMTDNEVVKALECCSNVNGCKGCCYYDKTAMCITSLTKDVLFLINRQKAENDDLYYKLHGVMLSVDKWLDGEELEQDEVTRATTMREKTLQIIERQQAEIESLNNHIGDVTEMVKAEAIKEFAERLKEEIINDTAYGCDINQHSGYYDYTIKFGDIPEYIDNLVKEMVGDDNANN